MGIRVPIPYNSLWVNVLGMEYRCRLGTTSGEIIEGVYVAQNEAALRRELEDKGLHVLSLKPRMGLGGLSFGGAGKIKRHEFLVFNQELATLLKAGMPLVQSLDILRQRVTNVVFKGVIDDVYERVRAAFPDQTRNRILVVVRFPSTPAITRTRAGEGAALDE